MPIVRFGEIFRQFQDRVQRALANPSERGPLRTAIMRWGEFYRSFARERFYQYSRGGGDWPPLAQSTIRGRRNYRDPAQLLRASKKALRKSLVRLSKARRAYQKKPTDAARAKMQKAQKTVKEKRERIGKAKKRVETAVASTAILIDTATMVGGLAPTLDPSKGGFEEGIPGGIRTGFGGPAVHPERKRVNGVWVTVPGKKSIATIAGYHNEGGGRLPRRSIVVDPPEGSRCVEQMARETQRAIEEEWRQANAG